MPYSSTPHPSRRRSPIWALPDDEFLKLVSSSLSFGEVLNALGFKANGGAFLTLQKRISELKLSTAHFEAQRKMREAPLKVITVPLEAILVEDSDYPSSKLKRRLFRAGLLARRCVECGLGEVWNNKPITLQLDHIDGNHRNNRLDNLRILCPNCHSQQPTWGRNKLAMLDGNEQRDCESRGACSTQAASTI